MILVDTSVWIDHFRRGDEELVAALQREEVVTHPFVIGELACGNIMNRIQILNMLNNLPMAPSASHDEVLRLIEARRMMGRGIAYVDAHLLAATALHGHARLWTWDMPLGAVAAASRLEYRPG